MCPYARDACVGTCRISSSLRFGADWYMACYRAALSMRHLSHFQQCRSQPRLAMSIKSAATVNYLLYPRLVGIKAAHSIALQSLIYSIVSLQTV